MTTVAGFAGALNMVKAVFPTSVVEWRNGSFTCEAIRSDLNRESMIDAMTGRMDPDRSQVRVNVAECGPLANGATVIVADRPETIEDFKPDAIGLTALVMLRKKRVVGQ